MYHMTEDTSSRVHPFLRGEGMGSLLNLNLSQSSGFSGDAKYGSGTSQADVENKVEDADDYSQTFKPVIQPGWYAFAPEKTAPGPGLSCYLLFLSWDTKKFSDMLEIYKLVG